MHQNRASPFASDFYCRRGYRKEFRSEDHVSPFSSQKKSRFASDFLRGGNRASWGLKNRAIFWGAVKIAAAAAENRATLVHSDGEKGRKTAKTHPESTSGWVLIGWVLDLSLRTATVMQVKFPEINNGNGNGNGNAKSEQQTLLPPRIFRVTRNG